MIVLAWLVGLAAAGLVVGVVFGLVSGRMDWRAQGCCCPADPAKDLRMCDVIDDAHSPAEPVDHPSLR